MALIVVTIQDQVREGEPGVEVGVAAHPNLTKGAASPAQKIAAAMLEFVAKTIAEKPDEGRIHLIN